MWKKYFITATAWHGDNHTKYSHWCLILNFNKLEELKRGQGTPNKISVIVHLRMGFKFENKGSSGIYYVKTNAYNIPQDKAVVSHHLQW